MNANESNLFRVFSSLAWFFRQIIWCSIAFTPHLLSTNWQEADNNRLRRHDEQIWKERDRQAIYVQKRKPNKIVWHLLNIVVYINSKKKILTMATVYKTGICLHVNTFWAVKLHLITIGRIMHENGKLTMTFSFWWYLNVQGILFISYTM